MSDISRSPINSSKVCPRLIDYLCIVGTRNYTGLNSGHAASVQTPELLRRYPPNDHKVSVLPMNTVHKEVIKGITRALDIVAPLVTSEVKEGKELYLAPDTLAMMRARDSAKPGTYRQLRNRVSALVRRDRLMTNLNKLDKASGDPKALWKLANEALGKPSASLPPSLSVNGVSTVSDREAADAMSNFYIEKDFPLPLNMVSFCQPEGCVSIGPKKSGVRDTTPFLFILTDKDSGLTRYGTCLNFYRPVEVDQTALDEMEAHFEGQNAHFQLKGDKSSDSAFSSDYRSSVSQVAPSDSDRDTPPSSLIRRAGKSSGGGSNAGQSRRRQRQKERDLDPHSDEEEDFEAQWNNGNVGRRKPKPSRIFSLTSLCFLSHHAFASNFRQCLMVLRQMIEMCEAACSPKRVGGSTSGTSMGNPHTRGKKRATLWSYLIGALDDMHKLPPSPLLMHDIREIETWIFRLLSAPVPVPGRTRVELEIVPRRDPDPGDFYPPGPPPLVFALPDHTRFSLCDYPIHLPLELLGVDTCLLVITLILLEKKIVIQSRDYSALTISILSLTKLIYPLEYMFPIIPLLPISMSGSEQLLLAPTPYIIGLPTSFLACKRNMKLPDEVWLVDLDSALIAPPPGMNICDIPPLPEPETKALKNHLKQALASMSIQPIKNFDDLPPESIQRLTARKEIFASPPVSGFNPFIYGNDVDSVDVATRVAMVGICNSDWVPSALPSSTLNLMITPKQELSVRFFYSGNMLANFSDHTRTLRLYPRPIVAFQVSSFLKSRTKMTSFISQFSQSQAIECFAEWVLMPTNTAFQRVSQGMFDPKYIGDKSKWFAHDLELVQFVVWDDQSSLTSLILKGVSTVADDREPATDESGCDSEVASSSSSCSSLSDLVTELMSEENSGKRHSIEDQQRALLSGGKGSILASGLDISLVYHPPDRFHIPSLMALTPAAEAQDSVCSSPSGLKSSASPSSAPADTSSNAEEDSSISESDPNQAHDGSNSPKTIPGEEHDDVFSTESENSESVATTKTMCNNKMSSNNSLATLSGHGGPLGQSSTGNGSVPGPGHPYGIASNSPSFGSNLSLASSLGSEMGTSGTGTSTPRGGQHARPCSFSPLSSPKAHSPKPLHFSPESPKSHLPHAKILLKHACFHQMRHQVEHRSQTIFPPALCEVQGCSLDREDVVPSNRSVSNPKPDTPGLPNQTSTSSNESPKPDMSPTDDVAQELFNSIEQFTMQAKQAAESFEFAKITNVGKSAAMAAVGKRDTSQDAGKGAMGDISTSMGQKKSLFKTLGESMSRGTSVPVPKESDPSSPPDADGGPSKPFALIRRSSREFMKSIGRDLIGSANVPPSPPVDKTVPGAKARVGTPVPNNAGTVWRFNHNSMSVPSAIANRTSPRPSVSGSPPVAGLEVDKEDVLQVENGSAKRPLPKVPPRPHSMKRSTIQRSLSREPPPIPPRARSEERSRDVMQTTVDSWPRRGPRPRLKVLINKPLPTQPPAKSSAGNTPAPTTTIFQESEVWATQPVQPTLAVEDQPASKSNGTPPTLQNTIASPKIKRLTSSNSSSSSSPSIGGGPKSPFADPSTPTIAPATPVKTPATPIMLANTMNLGGTVSGPPSLDGGRQTSPLFQQPSRPGLTRSNSTLSTTSNVSQTTQDFLMSLSTDISGFATTTSTLFGDLFGTRPSSPSLSLSSEPPSTYSSLKVPSKNGSRGPFPRGRRGLAERSSLIRHPSSKQKQEDIMRYQQFGDFHKNPAITADNHNFIKDIVDQVFNGDGISWLRHSRLKKLMEDESHRMLILSKLNKTLERKTGANDHVDDVCLDRPVWKGVLKIVLAIVHGLEVSVSNSALGGLSSAFHVLEIAHTHFWTRETNLEHSPSGSLRSGSLNSTPFGSGDNLSRLDQRENSAPSLLKRCTQLELGPARLIHDNLNSPSGSAHSGESDSMSVNSDPTKLLRKHPVAFRGPSLDSTTSNYDDTESDSQSMSETGSFMVNPAFRNLTKAPHHSSMRSVVSDSEIDPNSFPLGSNKSNGVTPDVGVLHAKSALSSGFRFHGGALYTSVAPPQNGTGKVYIFEGILQTQRSSARRGSLGLGGGSYIWDCDQFWEDTYCDAVGQERDIVGMDSGAGEMMERYRNLSGIERKRLEQDEDRLLSTMLYNLIAFMVLMGIEKRDIKKKGRRLLGKSHIGLIYSQEINQLLDQIEPLAGNDIDLKALPSRQMNRQTFSVHIGTDVTGDLQFLEVREDGLILRSINGAITDRWFYERLVNMTYSPRTKVICLWRRCGGQTQLHKFHTKKCKMLYYCIKEAMERAAARGTGLTGLNMELGGEFPVEDLNTGEGGLLQVCMEGIGLLFANSKFFVRLDHIRKCFTQKGGIFVLEEFNPKSRQVNQRRYSSSMADQICYSVLCVFSYVAAGQKQQKRPASVSSSTTSIRSRVSSVRKM
eukprot:maker-scaffold161_size295871-snap-gene-0.10 protein:Tk05098 transcript:maker-scaffold161_size295871-snap-gene-0.10-mRNA-1 annotation:"map kinase-activating death domain isoform x3"